MIQITENYMLRRPSNGAFWSYVKSLLMIDYTELCCAPFTFFEKDYVGFICYKRAVLRKRWISVGNLVHLSIVSQIFPKVIY